MKKIRIECSGSEYLALDQMVEFQEGLKKRTTSDINKIKLSILKYGFSFPFFCWPNKEAIYILDGHGRRQALELLRDEGYELPDFPIVKIKAKTQEEAKEKLLRKESQYGIISKQGIIEFMGEIEIKADEISFPEIDFNENINIKGNVENLEPYTKIHVLISFHPKDYIKIAENLKIIQETEGIEYEQSAN